MSGASYPGRRGARARFPVRSSPNDTSMAAKRKRTKPTRSRRKTRSATAPRRVLLIPLALTAGILGLSFLPRVQQHPTLIWSFWLAVIGLLVWQGWLRQHLAGAAPRGFDVVIRKQHWIQAILHTSVFVYWGTYWTPVADHVWLLVGQLLFC